MVFKRGFLSGLFLMWCAAGIAQTPNALQRLQGLQLSRLDGAVLTYYSAGVKPQALRDQAEIAACAAWYARQLHAAPSITLAVLNEKDWNRIGSLATYPMAEAFPEEGDVIFMPESFQNFPGHDSHADTSQELNFIAFHETGHIFQRATHFVGPDLFVQEFYATLLATAYSLHARPELIEATLRVRAHDSAKQRYTSFEDMDLISFGVGFNNYDWFQIETLRLALYFVKGQDLGSLVQQMRKAFPASTALRNSEILVRLDGIRPGFLAQAGTLGRPTTLPLLKPGKCAASPTKSKDDGYVGVWNNTGHPVTLMEEGHEEIAPPGYTSEVNKTGAQFQLRSGGCIPYSETPGYIIIP